MNTIQQQQTFQQLSDKILELERQVKSFRAELEQWRKSQRMVIQPAIAQTRWVSKEAQKMRMRELFKVMELTYKPVGIKKLQQEMEQADLELHELSRGIIAMREE